jgi:hypothetical protein
LVSLCGLCCKLVTPTWSLYQKTLILLSIKSRADASLKKNARAGRVVPRRLGHGVLYVTKLKY